MKPKYTAWEKDWPKAVVDCDTSTALKLLSDYYGSRPDGTPSYTGARFEAVAALNPNPYTLGPADFVAVSLLSVNVPKEAVIRLLRPDTQAEISRLLSQIRPDIDIVDCSPDRLIGHSPAGRLWKLLRGEYDGVRDGVGRTTTSKLIAVKRPRLIPIWDSFVQRATDLDTADYWREFQTVLLDQDRRIWKWLASLKSQVSGLPEEVSTLRILDVLLWMWVETDGLC